MNPSISSSIPSGAYLSSPPLSSPAPTPTSPSPNAAPDSASIPIGGGTSTIPLKDKDKKKVVGAGMGSSPGMGLGAKTGPGFGGGGGGGVAMVASGSGSGSGSLGGGGGGEMDDGEGGKSGKNKDLSHVPCRFFKIGACQAGISCPFSHSATEPGRGKEVCQWYLKGNCRFGHKCALAHLNPGEPPMMDRKNKKAAQLANQGKAEPPNPPSTQQHNHDRNNPAGESALPFGTQQQQQVTSPSATPSPTRKIVSPTKRGEKPTGLMSAASAPTVGGGVGRGKSYSEMARAAASGGGGSGNIMRGSLSMTKPVGESRVQGTGSAAGTTMEAKKADEALVEVGNLDKTPTPQASTGEWTKRIPFISGSTGREILSNQSQRQPAATSGISQAVPLQSPEKDTYGSRPLTVPGPMSSFRQSSFEGIAAHRPAPIGTPPSEIVFGNTSGGSPFSAPGSKSIFPSSTFNDRAGISRPPLTATATGYSDTSMAGSGSGSKLFSSSVVGAEFGLMGRDIWGQRSSLSRTNTSTNTSPPIGHSNVRPFQDIRRDSQVFMLEGEGDGDDDQGEEFLPSSLNELLTPRERARRLSRQDSNQKSGSVGISMGWPQTAGVGNGTSASSSWDGRMNTEGMFGRQAQSAGPITGGFMEGIWDERPVGGGLSRGANTGSGNTSGLFARQPSSSGETPLSSSAVAFLPGFAMASGSGSGRTASGGVGLIAHSPSRPSPLHHFSPFGGGGVDASSSAMQDTETLHPSSTMSNTSAGFLQPQMLHPPTMTNGNGNGLGGGGFGGNVQPMLSPGSRALQSHAPGQSLPGGIAAGLSRLHLRPAMAMTSSGKMASGDGGYNIGGSPSLSPSGGNHGMQGRQQVGTPLQLPRRIEGDEDDLFEMDS